MTTVLTIDNVDLAVPTGSSTTQAIPAPAANQRKRASLTFTHTGAVGDPDVTVDFSRADADGSNERFILKNQTLKVGAPIVLTELILKTGRALRFRASVAGKVDFTADVVTFGGV